MELRIHGIGGPSPESVLVSADPATSPRPGTVAFAVWRSEPSARSSVRSFPQRPEVAVYHWAPLTSGSRFFALWPLLLPFTLLNVAGWMLPRPAPTRPSQARVAVARGVVVVLGWVLTVAVVCWFVWVGQVIALQRAPADGTGGNFGLMRAAGLGGSVAAIGVVVLAATYTAAGFERFSFGRSNEPLLRPKDRRRLDSLDFFRDGREHALRWRWHALLVVAGLAVCGWFVIDADDPVDVRSDLGDACAVVSAVQVGLLLVLMVSSGRGTLRRVRGRPTAPALLGSFSVAAIGSLLVGGLCVAGAIVFVGFGGIPAGRATIAFDVFGWSVAALAVVAAAVALLRLRTSLDAEQADPPVLGSVAARFRARVATIPRTLDVAVAAMALCLVVGGVAAIALRWDDAAEGSWTLRSTPPVVLGRLTVVALVGFMVSTVWRRRVDAASLRRVGNVWDVLTFWPRTYHPFAVRPYAERAVPELQLYLRQAVPSGEPLTIVAHSQGAVLAAAALAPFAVPQPSTLANSSPDSGPDSTPAHPLTGVRLVTLGSPLRVLYARWFPAHFAAVEFDELHGALQQHGRGWVNVHRHTDHWGGPTFAGDAAVDDHTLADPPERGRPLAGHGGYWGDPLVEALVGTTERTRVGASGGER
jgi:hypothetical protein